MAEPKRKRKAKIALPRGIRQRPVDRFIIDLTVEGARQTATADTIDRYVISLMENGASDATINRKLSVLSRILRTGMDRGLLDKFPKPPRRKERQGRIRFLTAKEETEVLRWFRFLHLGKNDHWDAIVILIDTGFRTGEVWRVRDEHMDFARDAYGIVTLWRTKHV